MNFQIVSEGLQSHAGIGPLAYTQELELDVFAMVKSKVGKSKFAKRYPKEFRREMVELYRAGKTLTNLSQRFGPRPERSAGG